MTLLTSQTPKSQPIMVTPTQAPFSIATAFSGKPFNGNPALVVFLDPTTVPFKTLHGISLNFNQPMACFVKPFPAPEAGQTEIHTDIQFVPVTGKDVGICGHGSLASAKAILSLPEYKDKGIDAIHFRTVNNRGTITVRILGGDRLEVELPASPPVPVPSEVEERITNVVNRAFGREVKINNILEGGKDFKHVVLVDIDKSENLEGSQVEKSLFGETGYSVNVVTSQPKSSGSAEVFASRMFSKEVPGFEDHVCGSAHCLVVPYWYSGMNIEAGKEVLAKMASERGGWLNVNYDLERGKIRLAGEAALLSTGVCYF